MKLFLLTLVVFGIVFVSMSVGVILGRRRIRGSCGGESPLDGKHGKITCDACSSNGQVCGSRNGGQVTTNF